MGDRGNIVIQEEPGERVYLYTHWSGAETPGVARLALSKHWRWDDAAYLARIVFDVMLKDQHDEETGFGISSTQGDDNHPNVLLDVRTQRVWFERPGEQTGALAPTSPDAVAFKEFVAGKNPPGWY